MYGYDRLDPYPVVHNHPAHLWECAGFQSTTIRSIACVVATVALMFGLETRRSTRQLPTVAWVVRKYELCCSVDMGRLPYSYCLHT